MKKSKLERQEIPMTRQILGFDPIAMVIQSYNDWRGHEYEIVKVDQKSKSITVGALKKPKGGK